MLQRLFEQCEAVGAALDSLHTDLLPLSSLENDTIEETAKLLGPFHQATEELWRIVCQDPQSFLS